MNGAEERERAARGGRLRSPEEVAVEIEDEGEGMTAAESDLGEVLEGGSVFGDREEERFRQGELLSVEWVD